MPEGSAGRVVGDAVKYNEVAAKVMRENDVAIEVVRIPHGARDIEAELKS